MDDPTSIWIQIARLLRPQGRRGELLVEPLTDQLAVFSPGRAFGISDELPPTRDLPLQHVEECWQPHGKNAGRVVLKLAGIDSITEAEQVEGRVLWLKRSDLPALDPGTFFVRDLVGCALVDCGSVIGTVVDLQFAVGPDGRTRLPDAPDLLVVQLTEAADGEDPVLVPFVKAWLQSVDMEARRIAMQLPEGLLR